MIDRLRDILAAARGGEAAAGPAPIIATSFVSMALRISGILLSLLSQLYLARLLGVAEYGRYAIALGWTMLLVIVVRRGLDNMALRMATHYWEEGRKADLAGLVRYSLRGMVQSWLAILGGLAAVKLLWAGATAEISWTMIVAIGATMLPLAMLGFYSSLLRSSGRVVASQSFEQLWRPSILILLLIAAHLVWDGPRSAVTAMGLTAVSMIAAIFLATLAWRRSFRVNAVGQAPTDRAEWHSISAAFVVMALAQEALNQSGILLLGIMASNAEAAHFSAAWRYNSLLTFGLAAVGLVSGPLIASAYRRSDRIELAAIARTSARFSLTFAALAAAPLVIGGKLLLDLFGPSFDDAYPALLILLVGSLANASTGVVGYFLSLTGGHGVAARVMVGALALNLAANAILIPIHGASGAAIASAGTQILWNLALVVSAKKHTGVTSWAFVRSPR